MKLIKTTKAKDMVLSRTERTENYTIRAEYHYDKNQNIMSIDNIVTRGKLSTLVMENYVYDDNGNTIILKHKAYELGAKAQSNLELKDDFHLADELDSKTTIESIHVNNAKISVSDALNFKSDKQVVVKGENITSSVVITIKTTSSTNLRPDVRTANYKMLSMSGKVLTEVDSSDGDVDSITTYTYHNGVLVYSCKIKVNGEETKSTFTEYDEFGRVSRISSTGDGTKQDIIYEYIGDAAIKVSYYIDGELIPYLTSIEEIDTVVE